MQATMEEGAGIYRNGEALQKSRRDRSENSRIDFRNIVIEDDSRTFNTEADFGTRAGVTCSTWPLRSSSVRFETNRISWSSSKDRFPQPGRRQLPGALTHIPKCGWLVPNRVPAGHHHALAALGTSLWKVGTHD